MGLREYSYYTTTDQAPVTTAETVIATVAGLSTDKPGQSVHFTGAATVLLAAGTTGVTLRVREDSVTGTVVGEAVDDAISTAAGSVESHGIDVTHANPGEFSSKTYVMTIVSVGATANATVQQAALTATIKP